MAAADTRVSEKIEEVRSRAEEGADRLQSSISELETRVVENPWGAIALAAGAGFLLSKLRADKAVLHLGGLPFILGAFTTYLTTRR